MLNLCVIHLFPLSILREIDQFIYLLNVMRYCFTSCRALLVKDPPRGRRQSSIDQHGGLMDANPEPSGPKIDALRTYFAKTTPPKPSRPKPCPHHPRSLPPRPLHFGSANSYLIWEARERAKAAQKPRKRPLFPPFFSFQVCAVSIARESSLLFAHARVP